MATNAPNGHDAIEPIHDAPSREELACLAYFLARLEDLRTRGLLDEKGYGTARDEALARRGVIERSGRYAAALAKAGALAGSSLRAAAEWAARAREVDPSGREARELEVELLRKLGDDAEAIARSVEAVALWPGFRPTPEMLRLGFEARDAAANDLIARAREALSARDDDRVILLCSRKLDEQPGQFDATALLAFASQRSGRLEEALTHYRALAGLQPENAAWRGWIDDVERRIAARPRAARPRAVREGLPAVELVAVAKGPRWSWKEVAGEFVQDHWQKLILCLAVLLIVVSSNVGAYQLLGPRLWSPAGKCVLALVYSAMFAALGLGLVRWGAERAGRIMLLTTLIVIPADFMLAGQMKLLAEPTAWNLGVLAVDAAALFVLMRVVAGSIGWPKGAGAISAALFVLSAFNATAPGGASWPWGLSFGLFLAPAFVYLAATVWLTTRFQEGEFEGRAGVTYLALGLLTFATVSGLARTGTFAMELAPTLYAVPAMVLAIAGVQAASRAGRWDPEPTHAAWLRLGGLVVSGIGLALALARPPGSAIYSGNTLAAALLGLGIYAALLRKERQPAYLYFGFGALFLAYFGTFYFVKDLMQAVEKAAQAALGYDRPLPLAFKSINGLVFSPLLAGLSIFFRKRWGDARLARHCHYLGVPFAVAACVLSGFEPKAGLICLSGYAVLFALGAAVFGAPRVVYLATAALAGACFFGSTLWPGLTVADQALGASVLGLACWAVGVGLRGRGVGRAYRMPLGHAAIALAVIAMAGGAYATLDGRVLLASALAFVAAAGVAVLVSRDMPRPALAYLAVVAGNAGAVLMAAYAAQRWYGGMTMGEGGLAASAGGLASVWLATRLSGREGAAGVYPTPLIRAGIVLVAVTLVLCGLRAGEMVDRLSTADFAAIGGALALAAGSLGLLTRFYPRVALAHLAVACGLGVWVCGFQVLTRGAVASFATYGVLVSLYALLLLGVEEVGLGFAKRRKGDDPDFGGGSRGGWTLLGAALPGFEIAACLGAAGLAIAGLHNGPAVVATFGAGSVAMFGSTRLRRSSALVGLGIALGVVAFWCATTWETGWLAPETAFAWLAVVSALLALGTAMAGGVLGARGETQAFAARPTLWWGSTLGWIVLAYGVTASLMAKGVYPVVFGAMATDAGALVVLTLATRRARFTYRAVLAAVLGVYLVIFGVGKGSPETFYVLGLVAVLLAMAAEGIGFVSRARATGANDGERLFAGPLFAWAVVLTGLATVPAYDSPWTMLVVGASFLVLVKGVPSTGWIYPAVACVGCAAYYGVLAGWPASRLVLASMAGGYGLLILGLLVRRAEPAMVRVLRLPGRGYAVPILNSAIVCAGLAIALRAVEVADGAGTVSGSAGLAFLLAGFCALMVKAYPQVGWVHLALGFASAGFGMAAGPRMAGPSWWLAMGMGLAIVWLGVSRGARRYGGAVAGRLGVEELGYAETLALWGRGFFGAATAGCLAWVGSTLVWVSSWPLVVATVGDWLGVMVALALGAGYVAGEGSQTGHSALIKGLHGFAVLAVWWLGAAGSPLLARGMEEGVYLPLSTAILAVGTVAGGIALARRVGGEGAWWETRGSLEDYGTRAGLGLALIAAVFTRGEVGLSTAAALAIAACAPALLALARGSVAGAYGAALGWWGAGWVGALVVARWFGTWTEGDRAVGVGVASLLVLAGLWGLAGWLRRREVKAEGEEPLALPARTAAIAFEQAALLLAWHAAGAVGMSAWGIFPPGAAGALAGVGVLFGLALFGIGMIARWGSEWLVYLVQSWVVGGYLYYRWAFPVPAGADALVLTLFGYLDLGLAEVLHRVGLARYARPTRWFALATPVLPIALGLWDGGIGGTRLDVLFGVATFYAMAGVLMRWRTLGYASAALYNAFLWVLWSRIGWTVGDHSPFFLIPVGGTAILFAEANRRSLGRSAVNAVRGIGLSLMYLSLALPVWQYQSLGAWVTLLLISLGGILAGIGLRVQVFLWLGLVGFVLDVVYQLGRVGMEHTLAKWAIMLVLGLLLVLFVALNEKKRVVANLRDYLGQARDWE